MRKLSLLLFPLFLFSAPAFANPHQVQIPLHEGRLRTEDLTIALLHKLHLPPVAWGNASIDLSDARSCDFVQAVNHALGKACRICITDQSLVVQFDPDHFPRSIDKSKQAIRVFTAIIAPKATANQRRSYGLLLPRIVDPERPLVILIHGLDCDRTNWCAMADLLTKEGYQVAYFTYPSDGPLNDSIAMLSAEMHALRETFPTLTTNIIAHSMGSLVARAYVEGDSCAGGVDHLILLAPPNQGSRWVTYRIALELQEHYNLWQHDPNWSPAWMITDGLGEAGRDLKPDSAFLSHLNSLPRREGVRYTIIAGNQPMAYRVEANALDKAAGLLPARAQGWWGVRQTTRALHHEADHIRQKTGSSDGPVRLRTTRLAGVDDYVVVPADHTTIYCAVNDQPPVAWPIIKDRLGE